jgi:hypothetical protein
MKRLDGDWNRADPEQQEAWVMRLLRVRFTMGTLLFIVAVVAANCWGFRHAYESDLYCGGRISYRLLPAEVGVIPLINVALIGTWVFAVKQFRSLRRGRETGPGSCLPGLAYFCLHFLMLGGLVTLFMPGVIQSVQLLLYDATGYVAEVWGAVFGSPKGSVPWVILESSILGVLISGPPLVLSWIGHSLATRYASTSSPLRFRAMTCLVSFGFASGALAICLTPQEFEDELEVNLAFQVVDQESGRPIAAAFVRMTDSLPRVENPITPRAFTDSAGCARLTDRFVTSGDRNAFQVMGVFSPWGRWLEVSAADHRTLRIPLTEVLGHFPDPVRPGLHKVALARGETRENSFQNLAGSYSHSNGFLSRWFQIEPDGRFAFCESGCVPPGDQEYGYLKWRDGEIVLVPISHPGRETHPRMAAKYRTIEWGNRLFLTSSYEREILQFCRMALNPNRPQRLNIPYGSLPRDSDGDKPQTGLPHLPPRVWVEFLVNEMSLGNEDGWLRLALNYVIPHFPKSEEELRLSEFDRDDP